MRVLFSLVGILIALAVVGVLLKKQLQAVDSRRPAMGAAGAGASDVPLNVQQQSQQLQNRIRDDVARAMQQAPARAGDAEQ